MNHIRRIVLACERDMEDFTAAMDAVNVDLDERLGPYSSMSKA